MADLTSSMPVPVELCALWVFVFIYVGLMVFGETGFEIFDSSSVGAEVREPAVDFNIWFNEEAAAATCWPKLNGKYSEKPIKSNFCPWYAVVSLTD